MPIKDLLLQQLINKEVLQFNFKVSNKILGNLMIKVQ